MPMLDVGSKAPAFKTTDQNGKQISLADLRGKKVVLYFYPRDDTPGCTKEACAFRDFFADFRAVGAEVLGVSTDTEASHKKFADKYKLPFTLLADADKKIVEAYGAWGEKSFMGKKYMGTQRITYIIDEKGKIAAVYPKVKPEAHAHEILEALKATA